MRRAPTRAPGSQKKPLFPRPARAENTFKEAVQVDPQTTRARYALGEFYRRTGRQVLAEAQFVKVTKIASKEVSSWISLGNYYASLRRLEEAEEGPGT